MFIVKLKTVTFRSMYFFDTNSTLRNGASMSPIITSIVSKKYASNISKTEVRCYMVNMPFEPQTHTHKNRLLPCSLKLMIKMWCLFLVLVRRLPLLLDSYYSLGIFFLRLRCSKSISCTRCMNISKVIL